MKNQDIYLKHAAMKAILMKDAQLIILCIYRLFGRNRFVIWITLYRRIIARWYN